MAKFDPGWEGYLGGSPRLSCKRNQLKMRGYMERRVTPAKRVTSLSWGPPPPCKQALNKANVKIISYLALKVLSLQTLPWSRGCWSAPFGPELPRHLPALDCHELYDYNTNRSGNRRNKLPDQGDRKREEVHVLPLKRSFALTHCTWTRKTPFCTEELLP